MLTHTLADMLVPFLPQNCAFIIRLLTKHLVQDTVQQVHFTGPTLVRYLIGMCRLGEDQEQLTACNALLGLLPIPSLMGYAVADNIALVLLARLSRLAESNKQLLDAMARVLQAARESAAMTELLLQKQEQIAAEMAVLDARIKEAQADGKEDALGTKRVGLLKIQTETNEREITRARKAYTESQARFRELGTFLQDSHRHLQATVLALAIISERDRNARVLVVDRLSFPMLMNMIDNTPFNLALHWPILHLMGALVLRSRKCQDSAYNCGLLNLVINAVKHASKLLDATSGDQSVVSSDSKESGSSGSKDNGKSRRKSSVDAASNDLQWSIEAAEERIRFKSAGLLYDMCGHCLQHQLEVLHVCISDSLQACQRLRETEGFGALVNLAGLLDGHECFGSTNPSSNTSSSHSSSASAAATAAAASASASASTHSGSSSNQSRAKKTAVEPRCEYCLSSQPHVYGEYDSAYYELLWGKNAHGRAGCLDNLAEAVR